MQMVAWMSSEPPFDARMFMGCIIVGYQVNVKFRRNAFVHSFQEVKKFFVAVTILASGDDRFSCNIQSGEQSCRSMPFIGVCHPFNLS